MDRDATPVGIAVVEHGGRYLVGARGAEGPLAGYAEFPGGKCRSGEASQACACRECEEETGLEVTAERLLLRMAFDYPHGPVDLSFWLCRPVRPETVAAEHRGFRWVGPSELRELKFPEANAAVIELLRS